MPERLLLQRRPLVPVALGLRQRRRLPEQLLLRHHDLGLHDGAVHARFAVPHRADLSGSAVRSRLPQQCRLPAVSKLQPGGAVQQCLHRRRLLPDRRVLRARCRDLLQHRHALVRGLQRGTSIARSASRRSSRGRRPTSAPWPACTQSDCPSGFICQQVIQDCCPQGNCADDQACSVTTDRGPGSRPASATPGRSSTRASPTISAPTPPPTDRSSSITPARPSRASAIRPRRLRGALAHEMGLRRTDEGGFASLPAHCDRI